MSYRSSDWIVGNLIPCCNKDPLGIEVQYWEVGINVLCSLLKDISTGVLVVVDLTILPIVQICPKWSYNVPGTMYWEPLRYKASPRSIKC